MTGMYRNEFMDIIFKSSLIEFHNSYPVLWNRLVQEAVTEYVFESEQFDDEYVFFTRSGFT